MATRSSVLAWRIPGMAGPGGLLSMGSHRFGHDWSDLAAEAAVGLSTLMCHLSSLFPNWFFCQVIYPLMFSTPPTPQSLSCVWLFVTPWTAASQVPLPYMSDSSPFSQLWNLISSLSALTSPFASTLSQHQSFSNESPFTTNGQNIRVSASITDLPMNIQGWFPLRLTGLILLLKRLSRVFPAPQFKSINSSMLSLLYCPSDTSIHDYWKNSNFDFIDHCQQGDVFAF